MEQTQHKKVGIIGGMGPLATADLFEKITHLTKADADSKHIHVIIDSDTSIPDRTAAILGLGPDPTDELKAAAKRLENAGADILLMPCNTAHYFYPAIQASTKCPILHMLRLTAEEIKSRGHIKVALLATDGTVKTGIYAKLFEEYGINYMLPEPEEQRLVMSMIYDGIKADNEQYFDTEPIKAALRAMQQRGADAFVLGVRVVDDRLLVVPVGGGCRRSRLRGNSKIAWLLRAVPLSATSCPLSPPAGTAFG